MNVYLHQQNESTGSVNYGHTAHVMVNPDGNNEYPFFPQGASDHYAFIGLERVSGIYVYRISEPENPGFAGYLNVKEYGDISPEGLVFIKQDDKTGWLLVSNEVSNTTSLYEVKVD